MLISKKTFTANLLYSQPNISHNSQHKEIQQVMRMRQICPCCSSTLLRHIHRGAIYWHCSHCRQKMPTLSTGFLLMADDGK